MFLLTKNRISISKSSLDCSNADSYGKTKGTDTRRVHVGDVSVK